MSGPGLSMSSPMLYSKALRSALWLYFERRRRLNVVAVKGGAGFTSKGLHMYAVIKTGGKQYKVAAGEKIKVEQIAADVGQEVVIDQVLAVGSGADLKVGAPWVAGASVTATVLAQGKHDKVRIFKMRRRKHYQKHGGHRQTFTELQISSING